MIDIDGRQIAIDEPPYIIAEMSANHDGSLQRAKRTIFKAKSAGADAVKIQTYTPETMTLNCDNSDFVISDGLWRGRTMYDLYSEAHTPLEWHKELFAYARKIGITIFSTAFDESAVDLLISLDTPAFKIASFEITDLPLLEYVGSKNKPIILSTGMASLGEVAEAVETIRKTDNKNILLLHCISSYPAPVENSNLNRLTLLRKEFGLPVGLSDHSTGNLVASAAVAIGAVAIEKHFKIDNSETGPDSSFSILPRQLTKLCNDCKNVWRAMGKSQSKITKDEVENKRFRRSLYFVEDAKKGSRITIKQIKRVRPAHGLEPKYYKSIIGKKLVKNVKRGDRVQWSCFEKD